MASKTCDFCHTNVIGIASLAVDKDTDQGYLSDTDGIFNMGLDQYVGTEEEAADIILKRNFPTTLELKDVNKATFQPGMIGVIKVPKIFLSEISDIAEPKEYEKLLIKKSKRKLTKEEQDVIKKETAERVVFEGIAKYFDSKKEDLYIFTNQDLRKKIYWEKDALIVNLTKGYVFVIEAKSYLTKKIFRSKLFGLFSWKQMITG